MPRINYVIGRGFDPYQLLQKGISDDKDHTYFENEKHATDIDPSSKTFRKVYNYLGPGTAYEKRQMSTNPKIKNPINDLDRVAMAHDKAYHEIKTTGKERQKDVHGADAIFIKDASMTKDSPMTAKVAANAMTLKMKAEEMNILPSTIFSGGKINISQKDIEKMTKHLLRPTYYLEREANKSIKGGFAPIVASILGSLAVEGLSRLVPYIAKKIKGEGLSQQEMFEKYIKLPPKRQEKILNDALTILQNQK